MTPWWGGDRVTHGSERTETTMGRWTARKSSRKRTAPTAINVTHPKKICGICSLPLHTMGCQHSHPRSAADMDPPSPQPRCLPRLICHFRSRPPGSRKHGHQQGQTAQTDPHVAFKADGEVFSPAACPSAPVQQQQQQQQLNDTCPSLQEQQQQQHHQQVRQPPDPSRHIPLELLLLCAQHLPANDVTCTIRTPCREANAALSPDPRHRTARLDAPLPPHVAAWSPKALDNACGPFASLSFVRKLSLPAVAAATGSTANLELAWRLVRPCLCPELPLRHYTSLIPERADAGVAAVRAGRPDMVVWLVERRCPLVPARAARAAAVHCSLAGLQGAWGALLRLDPGLGAEAWACWWAVHEAADDGLVRSSGAGSSGAGSGGCCGCEEVQRKGAWLRTQHQEHKARQQQRVQDLLQFEWWWCRRPGSVSAAGGSGCCRCRARFQVQEWASPSDLLLKAAWAGNVEAARDIIMEQQQALQQAVGGWNGGGGGGGGGGGEGGGGGGRPWWGADTAFLEAWSPKTTRLHVCCCRQATKPPLGATIVQLGGFDCPA